LQTHLAKQDPNWIKGKTPIWRITMGDLGAAAAATGVEMTTARAATTEAGDVPAMTGRKSRK
jgi:hypothetical protein